MGVLCRIVQRRSCRRSHQSVQHVQTSHRFSRGYVVLICIDMVWFVWIKRSEKTLEDINIEYAGDSWNASRTI